MGRKMLNKLHSRKGASLTFALLAFLVCAVISAVLLASASAAAGRASGLAVMDQRYYAVTSAAQLFCDALANNNEYTFARTYIENSTKEIPYVLSESGFVPVNPQGLETIDGTSYVLEFTIKDKTDGTVLNGPVKIKTEDENNNIKSRITNPDFLTEFALYYLFEDYNDDVDVVLGRNFASSTIGHAKEWEMTLTVGGTTPMSSLTVDVTAKLDKSGNIVFKFTNHQDGSLTDAKKKTYSVSVTLGATIDVPDPTVKSRTIMTVEWEDDTYYTEVYRTKVEKTKTTTFSWSVISVSKVTEVEGSSDGENGNEGGGQIEP